MGESGASRIGRVGDVQPTVVPAAAAIKVAGIVKNIACEPVKRPLLYI